MSTAVRDILFCCINVWYALKMVAYQVADQTHYHTAALLRSFKLSVTIAWEYCRAVPTLFITHYMHNSYLHELGFPQEKNLSDNGRLVWKTMAAEGNNIGNAPTFRVTGFEENVSGNPSHMSIASTALERMWEMFHDLPGFYFEDAVFVDFGCGTGLAVISAMTQPFRKIIGVELDERTARLGQQNVDRFLHSRRARSPIRCRDVTVLKQDMSEFDYATALSNSSVGNGSNGSNGDTSTIVLYMYEPLWTLSATDAHPIYTRILQQAATCGRPVLVAYFYAGDYSGNAVLALQAAGAKLLRTWRFDSLNFACGGPFFLYKLA